MTNLHSKKKIKLETPIGVRDYSPDDMKIRSFMLDTIRNIFELYNDSEIAFYLHWDDPTVDPILKTLTIVEESPAPPLPSHLQVDESDEELIKEEPRPQKLSDSFAIQFPVSLAS